METRQAELTRLKKENKTIKHHNIALQKEIRSQNSVIDQLLDESGNLQRCHDQYLKEIQNLRTSLQDAHDLLAAKTRELESADQFLSSADDASIADARKEIEALNNEILQFAAFLVDTLVFERPVAISESSFNWAYQTTVKFLGHRMCSLIHSAEADTLGFAVQVAVQSLLCTLCATVVQSWCIYDENFSECIEDLYHTFCNNGSNQIAGTWRKITRAHIHQPETFTVEDFSLVDTFASRLAQLLRVAGWTKTFHDAHNILLSRYRSRLFGICSSALRINKLFGEQISSVDLEIFNVAGGSSFESSSMVGGYQDKRGNQVVLGTTDLGMVQRERQGRKGIPTTRFVLMKPKVILGATFEI